MSVTQNKVKIVKESDVTKLKEIPAKSAVGVLYTCNIKDEKDVYIYKEFREKYGGGSKGKLEEMKLRIPIWSVLNKTPVFMKVLAVVTDKEETTFKGLILENLAEYRSVHEWCEKGSIFDEAQFIKLVTQFLSICNYLFLLNLCSHIEHGGNLLIKFDDGKVKLKVVDLDDVGGDEFVDCSKDTEKQFSSLLQLDTILINCRQWQSSLLGSGVEATLGNKDNKIYKMDSEDFELISEKYQSIPQVIKYWGLKETMVDSPSVEDIKEVHSAIQKLHELKKTSKTTHEGGHNDIYYKKYLKYKNKYINKKNLII